MKTYFKSTEANQFMNNWISSFPESSHPLDTERFHELVLSLLKSKEELTEDILRGAIKSEKEWNDDYVNEFVEEKLDDYFCIKSFYDFLVKKGQI